MNWNIDRMLEQAKNKGELCGKKRPKNNKTGVAGGKHSGKEKYNK